MSDVTVKQMLAAAQAAVPGVTPREARRLVEAGEALLVDVREPDEVAATGVLAGALHVPRGLIEFRADAELPWHEPAFRKDRCVVLYCVSGGRAALAGKTLKDMGYIDVRNLGGFDGAVEGGFGLQE